MRGVTAEYPATSSPLLKRAGYLVRSTQRVMNARLEDILVAGSWIKERGIFLCGALVSAHGCVVFGFVLCGFYIAGYLLCM